MAANVESMFYTREKPWHGLGTRVEEAPTSKEALELAGLNWKVLQKPIYTSSGTLIEGYKANVRNTDQNVLGIVTDSWSTIHTGDINGKMDEARETLQLANKYMNCLGKEFNHLQQKKISERKVMEFIEELLSSPLLAAEFGRTLYFKENENEIRSPTREILTVCCVDAKGSVLAVESAFMGTSSGAYVGMKELFMSAILCNAEEVICFHNHPSGDPHPSVADNLMTQRIEKAGAILDIKLRDHIIIGEQGYYSYGEKKVSEWRDSAHEKVS